MHTIGKDILYAKELFLVNSNRFWIAQHIYWFKSFDNTKVSKYIILELEEWSCSM